MQARIHYEFSGKLWKYSGKGSWYFISLPQDISKEIRENLGWQEEGWGRMKAVASIGKIEWDTAIWFDKGHKTYILPIKAEIRRSAGLVADEVIMVSLSL